MWNSKKRLENGAKNKIIFHATHGSNRNKFDFQQQNWKRLLLYVSIVAVVVIVIIQSNSHTYSELRKKTPHWIYYYKNNKTCRIMITISDVNWKCHLFHISYFIFQFRLTSHWNAITVIPIINTKLYYIEHIQENKKKNFSI